MKKSFLRNPLGCLLLLPLLLISVPAQANDFEAALSSETAQFTFRSDSSLIGWGGAELAAGVFYNDIGDFAAQLSLMQRRQSSKKAPLTFGVGAKLYLGELDDVNQTLAGIAIGGEVRYTIPGVMPMSAYLSGHFAPKITSFSDIEQVTDVNLGFQLEVLPQTTAFAGIRRIDVDLKNGGNYEMDDNNIHFGVRFVF